MQIVTIGKVIRNMESFISSSIMFVRLLGSKDFCILNDCLSNFFLKPLLSMQQVVSAAQVFFLSPPGENMFPRLCTPTLVFFFFFFCRSDFDDLVKGLKVILRVLSS